MAAIPGGPAVPQDEEKNPPLAVTPAPQPVRVPIRCDVAWLASLFPQKDPAKLEAWATLFRDNEFDTLQELVTLNDAGWEALKLPLAVTSVVRKALAEQPHFTVVAPVVQAEERPPVNQLDMVVMDVSGSMRSKSKIDVDKTREDVSKMLFHTLMDRLVSLELSHAVGLLSFGAKLTLIKEPTREYERFHDELGRLDANEGHTMLWDAVYEAGRLLLAYAQTLKLGDPPILRVFALTDGEDNKSERKPWQVAQFLQANNILLDAIPVAGPNRALGALAKASGGLCFDVTSNEQANGLFEREATLHVAYREPAEPAARIESAIDFGTFQEALPKHVAVLDVKSAVPKQVFSPCWKPAEVEDQISKKAQSGGGGASVKRILKEYQDFMSNPPPGWSVSVSAEDCASWKAIVSGSPGPYQGGHWLVTVDYPRDYPFKPPKVRFVTPIYHCNISRDGAVCLDVLKDNWSPALTISKVFLTLSSLLDNPNPDDPLDSWKGELCKVDRKAYDAEVVKFTAENASASYADLAATYNFA